MNSSDNAFHRFRSDGSHDAFREVVAAHLPMVYGTALRLGNGNAAEAEDVAQMAFADLVRKARSLREGASVGAWLHRHTCFLMKNALRGETRRRARESAAAAEMQAGSTDAPTVARQWEDIGGRLDRCLESLAEADRSVLVLRFFEGRALREVGEALGIGDDAAQKRVSRALERLRQLLTGRKAGLSSASLASVMSARVRAEVPAHMAGSLAQSALRLAAVRSGAFAASGTSAAVITAWAGVVAVAAMGGSILWPHLAGAAQGGGVTGKEASPVPAGGAFRKIPLAGMKVREAGQNVPSQTGEISSVKKVTKPSITPAQEVALRASTLHKWMTAYALDHGGNYPSDLSALLQKNYGFPENEVGDYLGAVIEYRGRKLTQSDQGSLLLLRCRIPDDSVNEVRLYVSGSSRWCPASEPVHEDILPEQPSSIPVNPKKPERP